MNRSEEEDTRTYKVVVNDEEQYSILLVDQAEPPGWSALGKTGSKAECLAHIGQIWTDMRPLSLRKKLASLSDA
jgi:MbtH protein